jgi:hypothetical protein
LARASFNSSGVCLTLSARRYMRRFLNHIDSLSQVSKRRIAASVLCLETATFRNRLTALVEGKLQGAINEKRIEF